MQYYVQVWYRILLGFFLHTVVVSTTHASCTLMPPAPVPQQCTQKTMRSSLPIFHINIRARVQPSHYQPIPGISNRFEESWSRKGSCMSPTSLIRSRRGQLVGQGGVSEPGHVAKTVPEDADDTCERGRRTTRNYPFVAARGTTAAGGRFSMTLPSGEGLGGARLRLVHRGRVLVRLRGTLGHHGSCRGRPSSLPLDLPVYGSAGLGESRRWGRLVWERPVGFPADHRPRTRRWQTQLAWH